MFSEQNFGYHLMQDLESHFPIHYRQSKLIKIDPRLNNLSLKLKNPIQLFIRKKRNNLALTVDLKKNLLNKIKKINLKNYSKLNYNTPILKLRYRYYIDKFNAFTYNYFCINNLFAFDDLNQCFYFNLYIHSFIFQHDLSNDLYKEKTDPSLFRTHMQTGSLPLYNFLIALEFSEPNEYYTALLKLERQVRILLLDFQKNFLSFDFLDKLKLIQRLKVIRYFRQKDNNPSWMILLNLPVLPPDLRPILQLNNDQIAISDLNKLYQKVIFRNRRLQRLLQDTYGQNLDEIQYAHRLLQESVDALIENGKSGVVPVETNNNRPLKSLSDMLKGKKGRFRQNLLGKRVDYSGRSVIVVGPNLKIYECGIPIEMAIELFRPFIIKQLLSQKKAKTIIGAKQLIYKNTSTLLPLVKEIIKNYPVLLNRAPTLHRLSIQAFQPILVSGKAILLHPLVCSSFNADFDGDQMAVHIPLSFKARAEAWKLLWSVNNFISPATGQPILAPSQDIVLGCYFLTLKKRQPNKFWNEESSILPHPFKNIWMLWNDIYESDHHYQKLIELRIDKAGKSIKIYPTIKRCYSSSNHQYAQYIFTTVGRIIFHKILNY